MNGGKRKLSSWNIFVKKIYQEGHSKNKNYSFKQALTDASKRKSEMGSSSSGPSKKMNRKSINILMRIKDLSLS
jgi:recombinational DNA repair ATPase RecF